LADSLEFTGERFTPECVREIWYEHFHRYALAAQWCTNLRTLDAACGEGYGAALLANTASSVEAVDISEQTIGHARQRYGHIDQLNFQVADCTSLPFADHEFDRVVSFETLEHLAEQDQLLAEFRRVLKPEGVLILSSPDKAVYSDQQETSNEFHIKELYRDELESLIGRHFGAWRLLGQKLMFHSAIWSLGNVKKVSLDQVSDRALRQPSETGNPGITQAPMYFIALCAADQSALPESDERLWLFDDREETVYQHYHGEIKRNMAVGGIIAGLEKEIAELKTQAEQPLSTQKTWWRRWLGKT
jgi:SAM-dependent methyltransferase